ncbi:MAG: hypothetical protein J6T01_03135 [Kiritimatiellae bacterium]|nr:hypothetical protein [Kiritimatiellia bacterium]
MPIDYIVASLPVLTFGQPAPIDWARFLEITYGAGAALPPAWDDLETQLRNAAAEARGGGRFKRPAKGCALYWQGRVTECFLEKDVAKRDEMLDKVLWDAAGELTPPGNPLGRGAIATYAVRLKIAIKRGMISKDAGGAVFKRIAAGAATGPGGGAQG